MIKAFVRWIFFLFSRDSRLPTAYPTLRQGPYREAACVLGSDPAGTDKDLVEVVEDPIEELEATKAFSRSVEFRTLYYGHEIPDMDIVTGGGSLLVWDNVAEGWMVDPEYDWHSLPIVIKTENGKYVYVYRERSGAWRANLLGFKEAAMSLSAAGHPLPFSLKDSLVVL